VPGEPLRLSGLSVGLLAVQLVIGAMFLVAAWLAYRSAVDRRPADAYFAIGFVLAVWVFCMFIGSLRILFLHDTQATPPSVDDKGSRPCAADRVTAVAKNRGAAPRWFCWASWR
jgi:hypothetical protein